MEVSQDQAKQIEEFRNAHKSTDTIKVGNISTSCGEVKAIIFDSETPGESEESKKIKEWHNNRRELANKSVPEKVEWFCKQPGLIIFALFGKEIEPELRDRLTSYYAENPRRCYPDWSVFKGLYEERMVSSTDKALLKILIKHIQNDFDAVKKDRDYEASVLGLKPEELPKEEPAITQQEMDKLF